MSVLMVKLSMGATTRLPREQKWIYGFYYLSDYLYSVRRSAFIPSDTEMASDKATHAVARLVVT